MWARREGITTLFLSMGRATIQIANRRTMLFDQRRCMCFTLVGFDRKRKFFVFWFTFQTCRLCVVHSARRGIIFFHRLSPSCRTFLCSLLPTSPSFLYIAHPSFLISYRKFTGTIEAFTPYSSLASTERNTYFANIMLSLSLLSFHLIIRIVELF